MPGGDLRDGFLVGPNRVEPQTRLVTGPTGQHVLSLRQMSVLVHLAEHAGNFVDRHELLARSFDHGASEETLAHTIHEIRHAFGEVANPSLLLTLPRRGYLLVEAKPLGNGRPHAPAPVPEPASEPRPDGRDDPVQTEPEPFIVWFVTELWRRKVVRPFLGYLAFLAVVIGIANDLMVMFGLPPVFGKLIIGMAAIGLPIVLMNAWTRGSGNGSLPKVRPGGGVVEPPAVQPPTPRRWLRRYGWLVALVALALAMAVYRYLRDDPPVAPSLMAVMPFKELNAASPSGFGEGIADDVAHVLKLAGLRVVPHASLTAEELAKDVRYIGRALGVPLVVTGSVRRDATAVIIVSMLVDAQTGEALQSWRFERRGVLIVDLPLEVGRAIVAELKQDVGASAEQDFRRSRTARDDAYVLYYEATAEARKSSDLSHIARAADLLEQALAIDPEFAAAHAALCEVRLRKFDKDRDPHTFEAAGQSCEQASRLAPSLPETARSQAKLYESAGQYDKAESMYIALLQTHPNDAELHIGLGRVYEARRDWARAEASFRRATEVEPDRWSAHNSLGTFLWRRRRIEQANQAFERALEVAPNSAVTINNLGSMHLSVGDFARAAKAYQRSLAIEPSKGAYSNLGVIHYYQGRFADAERMYRKASQMGQLDYQVQSNLGETLWQMPGRRTEALEVYRRAAGLLENEVRLDPEDAAKNALLALMAARIGERARADALFAEALRLDADRADVQVYLAIDAADRGDTAAALTALDRAHRAGYAAVLIAATPDFRSLRSNPEFKRRYMAGGQPR